MTSILLSVTKKQSGSLFQTPTIMKKLPDGVDLEVELKNWISCFQVAKMGKPLRCPLSVAKDLKHQASSREKVSQLDFNFKLLVESILPSNLAEKSLSNFGLDKMELPPPVFQQVFRVKANQQALFIICDGPNVAVNNLMRSRIQCQCRVYQLICPFRPMEKLSHYSWHLVIEVTLKKYRRGLEEKVKKTWWCPLS